MTNNVQQRDEAAKSQEARRASEAQARRQESQISQINVTMLQEQEHM
jgi:hypothetical protein